MTDEPIRQTYRRLFERVPGACLIETDASGMITHFGPAAEAFFGRPAEEAIGKLHYGALHDAGEMEACRDDPVFREKLERDGWTEDDWTIVSPKGERFRARVTLVRAPAGERDGEGKRGWIALYRRISGV